MKKFTVPNWSQEQLAKAKGLDPCGVVVMNESDHLISFLEHKTRNEYLIDKRDGSVLKKEPQRLVDTKRGGAPTDQSQGTAS